MDAAFLQAPLVLGILLSWSLAAPPGPINALMAQAGARRFRDGLLVGMGAVAGDMTMLALTALGVLRIVLAFPWLKVVFAIVGAALMLWFAANAWRTARSTAPRGASVAGSFAKSFVIVVTSPYNWGWWLTAGSSMLSLLGWSVALGFFVGLALWVACWTGLARAGGARFARFAELVSYGAAVVLVAFAGLMLWYAATEGAALLAPPQP